MHRIAYCQAPIRPGSHTARLQYGQAIQPGSHIARLQNSQARIQPGSHRPGSHTARLAYGQARIRPGSHTARLTYGQARIQPGSHTARLAYSQAPIQHTTNELTPSHTMHLYLDPVNSAQINCSRLPTCPAKYYWPV